MKNNTIIIGDSYSTFEGYIPDGYEIYYSKNKRPETDVTKVSETWWYQLLEETNLNLILNNSWSGSPICYLGYNNTDCSKTSSFIYRLRKLISEGFFLKNKIDTVLLFGGTNDNYCGAPLGERKYEGFTEGDFNFVLPAICYFLKLLKETLPDAKIYCLINTDLRPEIESCLKETSERYGITPITFETIDKYCGHPTIKGMKDIKNTVLSVLNKE